MTSDRFLEKFDLFADAPNAVAKMRELAVSLAVQGKLVAQEPSDPPATELLKSIEMEAVRLAQLGLIKKSGLEPIDQSDAPFAIPTSWVWTRLGCIADWGSGSTPPKEGADYYGGGITWFRSGELNDNRQLALSEETITDLALEKCTFRRNRRGDVLLAMYGATIGKVAILAEDAVTNQAVCGCTPFTGVFNQYLFFFLLSQRKQFHLASEGGAQPNISKWKIIRTPFPLPPFPEQHRIVSKLDELMTLCDRLEAQQHERERRQSELARASLAYFAGDPTPARLSLLFHNSYDIATTDLRSSILSLAVQGRLVRREADAPMEPLESILAEASVNGVSKGPTSDSSATEVLRISAGTSRKDFYVDEDDFKYVALEAAEIEKFQILRGDLLACRFNGNLHYVGRFSYYRGQSGRTQVNPDKLIRFRVNTDRHCPRYICYAMNAPPTRATIESMCATTAGNIGLSAGRLKTVKVPLPTLSEQRRIVKRVEELMVLVDRLEEQLSKSVEVGERLLDAVVAELVE